MPDPWSTARVALKQVDVSALPPLAQSVVTTTPAAYTAEPTEEELADGVERLGVMFPDVPVRYDPSLARRSGGDGTLLREPSAYLVRSEYPGLVSFFDTGLLDTVELLAVPADIPERNAAALDRTSPSLLIGLRPLHGDPLLREAYGDARTTWSRSRIGCPNGSWRACSTCVNFRPGAGWSSSSTAGTGSGTR